MNKRKRLMDWVWTGLMWIYSRQHETVCVRLDLTFFYLFAWKGRAGTLTHKVKGASEGLNTSVGQQRPQLKCDKSFVWSFPDNDPPHGPLHRHIASCRSVRRQGCWRRLALSCCDKPTTFRKCSIIHAQRCWILQDTSLLKTLSKNSDVYCDSAVTKWKMLYIICVCEREREKLQVNPDSSPLCQHVLKLLLPKVSRRIIIF